MSPKRPSRDTVEGRAYLDVQNAARRTGRDTAEHLSLYALEGYLARLASSRFAEDFVLKGGVLLAAFAARRPTRDIDLHAAGFPSEIDEVVSRSREIAAIGREDGLGFDLEGITGGTIRDGDDYTGVRVTLTCTLFSARISLHLDVNFGNPIWPGPTTTRLGASPGDPRSTQRNAGRNCAFAQIRWAAWQPKQRLQDTTPLDFQRLIDDCAAFADPAIAGDVRGRIRAGEKWKRA